jgi:hypothetical protein
MHPFHETVNMHFPYVYILFPWNCFEPMTDVWEMFPVLPGNFSSTVSCWDILSMYNFPVLPWIVSRTTGKCWQAQYFMVVWEIFPGSTRKRSCIKNNFGAVWSQLSGSYWTVHCHNLDYMVIKRRRTLLRFTKYKLTSVTKCT